MASKEPVLAVFDIDGTLAHLGAWAHAEKWTDEYLMGLPAYPNMLDTVRKYLKMRNVSVMFCTGRPHRWHSATRRWLESKLDLANSEYGRRVTLVCRPDDTPSVGIPAYKLAEILQAIRRLGSNPSEAILFDDDINNLRLFETLKPMVRKLTIYRVTEGMVSEWRL